MLLLLIKKFSFAVDKIRNFLATYISHDKDLDRDFANIALNDDDNRDGSRTKGLKYMQQLVCFP